MFSERDFNPPARPRLSGNPALDFGPLTAYVDDVARWMADVLRQLNIPGTVKLSQASIEDTPVGTLNPNTGRFTTLEVVTSSVFPSGTWTPTDGSGAGLTLTVNSARVVKIGRAFVLTADITYPVTASGAQAAINGSTYTDAARSSGAVWSTAGNATSAHLVAAQIAFLTAGGVALTNANLSGATIRFTIVGQASA